jgi:hypothetical protein
MPRQVSCLAQTLLAFAHGITCADIYPWEYINPVDPSQGKQQSTTLCPGGINANAAPHTNFCYRNLTNAYLEGA